MLPKSLPAGKGLLRACDFIYVAAIGPEQLLRRPNTAGASIFTWSSYWVPRMTSLCMGAAAPRSASHGKLCALSAERHCACLEDVIAIFIVPTGKA